jgi:hypothetical protein
VKSTVDIERYSRLLQAVASMSRLYSDNTIPYVDSRFVEKLFVETTGAKDLSRSDKSFDALLSPDIGVGIKTFLSASGNSKREKVAEFTSFANNGEFEGLSPEELALKAAGFRNNRVLSDANELAIAMEKSIYHCLVRTGSGAIVHEEPYMLVDLTNLKPTDRSGNILKKWQSIGKGVFFTDGVSNYNFNGSKNVLFKEFKFDSGAGIIELPIFADIFDRITKWFNGGMPQAITVSDDAGKELVTIDSPEYGRPGIDFVVLPLYSVRTGLKEVPEKSGINQWNAGGRLRKFGEAYIPIPIEVHRRCPGFFPARDTKFPMLLPNSATAVPGKVCQESGKALMSDPNTVLGNWIMKVLRPSLKESDFLRAPNSGDKPFGFGDLLAIGKDSVIVRKTIDKSITNFSLEFAPLGSYEEFVNDF